MSIATIQVEVDEQTAQIYITAPLEKRKKIQALLSVWLKNLAEPDSSLESYMNKISEQAKQRGLTPATLEKLLADE